MEPKDSLPCSQESVIVIHPVPDVSDAQRHTLCL